MGVVYRARDTIHHRDVALKTVPRLEPGSVARLHAEARAMEALRHASLATIHEVAMWRGTPVLVLEYFPDGTLARRLRAGPLPAADVLWLARQVADALVYIHDRGALHGDLKPANIGLGPDAAPRLLDFGLATLIDAGTAGRAPGTVPYLPPEAFRGEPPGPLFDLWALAVVVAEALIGTHPFTARSQRATVRRILHANPAGITSHLPSPSRSLMTWLETALAPDPTRRFPNAREFRAALDRVIDASP
jgi:serine/threonine-protein kinase